MSTAKPLDSEMERIVSKLTMDYIKALAAAVPRLEEELLLGTSVNLMTDLGTHFNVRIGQPILNYGTGFKLPDVRGRIIH